jgi:AraC-like DNA-binding protein
MGFYELTGLVRLPLGVLDGAEKLGLDREELMRTCGLTREELANPDARVPVVKIWQLWKAVIRRTDDPALGLKLAEGFHTRGLGLIGYGMYHSHTLRDGLKRFARFSHIISEAVQVRVEEGDSTLTVVAVVSPRFEKLRHPMDARLSALLKMSREITGQDVVPLEVRFSYPRPNETVEHQRAFRCPLRFGSSDEAIVFRNSDADLPIETADETLGGYLDSLASEVLSSLGQASGWIQKVRRTVWEQLASGQPSIACIANELGMGSRTLQRRLNDAGVSYSKVVDDLRRAMSVKLLRDREIAIYEIAFLLGYSEPSTFHRAFRRWFEVTPREYRRSLFDVGETET